MTLNTVRKSMIDPEFVQEVQETSNKIGNLSELKTTNKTDIVKSVNEVTTQLAETALDNFNTSGFLEMPENYLAIPSILGNNLTTHPSVIDFGAGKQWNGYRYWMAHTPYPGTQNENPSITVSNDNKTWVLPTGAPNPLVPAPIAPSYYSDTEMIFIPETNKLRIYYRKAVVSETEGVGSGAEFHCIESADGSNWSEPIVSLYATSGMHLSPAIIRVSATDWKMWYVESASKFGYRTSTDGISWGAETLISQPWTNWSAWHIGVVRDSKGKYHMLGSTYPNAGSGEGTQYRPIVYASSNDGLTWVSNEKPQLIPTGWAGGYLYRPAFIIDESKGLINGLPYVRVWFGASDDGTAAAWHIGYSEGFLMPGGNNPSATNEKIKRKRTGEYFKVFASNIVASFAKISRIKTKRIEVTSDYSQPLIEFRDGRVGRGGSNYLRQEYLGGEAASNIRFREIFTDNEGNQFVITVQPFASNPTMIFDKPTNLTNVNQLQVTEIINRGGGIRSYRNDTEYNRITTDSTGALQIQLSARGGNYVWKFYAANGALDAGGNKLENLRFIQITQATAIASAPNGALFEDADGKLKYKNSSGIVTVLTP